MQHVASNLLPKMLQCMTHYELYKPFLNNIKYFFILIGIEFSD